jgi:hypothetical protein
MKVSRRGVPLDMLSVSKKTKEILIFTHRNRILFSARPEGCCGSDREMTFEQLYQWIQSNEPPPA